MIDDCIAGSKLPPIPAWLNTSSARRRTSQICGASDCHFHLAMACVVLRESGTVAAARPKSATFIARVRALSRFRRRQSRRCQALGCILSRPPVVNRMAGSSVSLLAIAEFFRNAGYRVAFIGVSAGGIGIRPFVKVDGQVFGAFDLYRIQGWHHIGHHSIRTDSLVPWIGAPLTLALRKCLPTIRPLLPTSIADLLSEYSRRVRNLSPASTSEVAFARGILRLLTPDRIFIDYFYLTKILETPEAVGRRSYVLTHQLFSERTRLDEQLSIRSEWRPVSEDEEMGALAKASTIIAFQEAEARTIRQWLPHHRIVTTPLAMPVRLGTTPQSPFRCLFVGSAKSSQRSGARVVSKERLAKDSKKSSRRNSSDMRRRLSDHRFAPTRRGGDWQSTGSDGGIFRGGPVLGSADRGRRPEGQAR